MKELLFMKPVFKEAVWGGKKLREDFGYEIPGDDTGECWGIGAHKNGDCTIAEGTYKGEHLSKLWTDHPELFGNEDGRYGKEFPLLIKIIDARSDLSIQVHPDNDYAREHENGSLGKTECWYILDSEPGTKIVIGHYAKDKEELKQMVEEETTKSGIILAGAAKEKPQQAEVIAVGPGGMVDGKDVKMEVKVGDQVIYSKYAGTEVKLEDETYIIVKQSDILAIVE